MTNTKIRIDLSQGVVEADGSEEFVRAIYNDFKDRIEATPESDSDGKAARKRKKKKRAEPKNPSENDGSDKTGSPAKKKKRTGKGAAVPKIVRDLDLSGGAKKPRLRDFYARFRARTNFERNLIFVYYMTHELELSGITVDHVFTCYRDVPNVKAPTALLQSLWDTSARRGWLNTKSQDDITVTVPGINYLEHDMPKADDKT